MIKASDTIGSDDPFNLSRFLQAQEGIYTRVLTELTGGRKQTHWIWYIFPQIDGWGHSTTTKHYSIKSIEEARHYLDHPILGKRLLECTEAVLAIKGRLLSKIFGYPDDLKFKSCMTLFAGIADPHSVFISVIDKHCYGKQDIKTLRLIEKLKEK